MQNILVFGAGKSSTTLIAYLKNAAAHHGWHVTIADMSLAAAQEKAGNSAHTTAVALDITDHQKRAALIQASDVVVSLLPPSLHILVARDCVAFGKHLLTASYVDDEMRALKSKIEEKRLFFLCEMGLDPGIDHMSAMKLIHDIKAAGGEISSFKSHCGGLVAAETDDNPWHYKVTWNPSNIVNAGKAGAVYKEAGNEITLSYSELFRAGNNIDVPGADQLAFYPNRDSLSYIDLYDLHETETFVRTTLRHPDFIVGWKAVVDAALTDASFVKQEKSRTYREFFEDYFKHNGRSEQYRSLLNADVNAFSDTATMLLVYLGITSEEVIPTGLKHPNEILQSLVEKNLMMQPTDKDRVVMIHEIIYKTDEKKQHITSYLDIVGDDAVHTAMAKTVGLPLAIATVLLMTGRFKNRGLFIPTEEWIYTPVLEQLAANNILFREVVH